MSAERAKKSPEGEKYHGEPFDAFTKALAPCKTLELAQQRLRDPYFQGEKPCSLLIDEIEWIWDAISVNDDWSRFASKVAEIRAMGKLYGRREI